MIRPSQQHFDSLIFFSLAAGASNGPIAAARRSDGGAFGSVESANVHPICRAHDARRAEWICDPWFDYMSKQTGRDADALGQTVDFTVRLIQLAALHSARAPLPCAQHDAGIERDPCTKDRQEAGGGTSKPKSQRSPAPACGCFCARGPLPRAVASRWDQLTSATLACCPAFQTMNMLASNAHTYVTSHDKLCAQKAAFRQQDTR